MKMAMTMTADGLIRALRWKAHDLAEDIERDYRKGAPMPGSGRDARAEKDKSAREQSDERAGR
ncbi:hypothetical protein EET67_13325 [Pseudaminobacter arsenicus]|uniref:Uncharacterized protein n=1 Tax=Borborobacter arsenicus TaxID=1851146 RepID=A0A432V5C1_9HYPH|nr:hypothetical protein [Pseudaminobacter arsenicus]RUM97339.1 hypothetical protein EET67_13325 [Pseudaminobacter arsenicus]